MASGRDKSGSPCRSIQSSSLANGALSSRTPIKVPLPVVTGRPRRFLVITRIDFPMKLGYHEIEPGERSRNCSREEGPDVANLVDPLLVLLRRHEAANSACDARASDAADAERDHLFAACDRTMHAIIDRKPAATTAEGAVAAPDHVLDDEALWHGPQYTGEMFLRLLIESARDYIIRTAKRAPPSTA